MFIDEGLDTGPDPRESRDGHRTRGERARRSRGSTRRHLVRLLLCTYARRTIAERNARAASPGLRPRHPCPSARQARRTIDWTLPARMIHCRMRGFDPWPGAFTFFEEELLKILRARVRAGAASGCSGTVCCASQADGILVCCGEGTSLLVQEVQPESRRPMSAHSFALGARIVAGSAFRVRSSSCRHARETARVRVPPASARSGPHVADWLACAAPSALPEPRRRRSCASCSLALLRRRGEMDMPFAGALLEALRGPPTRGPRWAAARRLPAPPHACARPCRGRRVGGSRSHPSPRAGLCLRQRRPAPSRPRGSAPGSGSRASAS